MSKTLVQFPALEEKKKREKETGTMFSKTDVLNNMFQKPKFFLGEKIITTVSIPSLIPVSFVLWATHQSYCSKNRSYGWRQVSAARILTPSFRNGQKRLHVPQSSNPKRSCPLAARVRKICVLSALKISGLSGSTRGTYLAIFQKMIKWNSKYRSKLVVKKKKNQMPA